MPIAESELIINEDGSIYHLNLRPGDLAETIITVGDQERVLEVSKYFDKIELRKQKREFTCHTGYLGGKRLSVISTGIGTDNIDIVFNEIDALFNVDFETRNLRRELTPLKFIRLGTSGCIQADIAVDQLLISESAIGIDNLNVFYTIEEEHKDHDLERALKENLPHDLNTYSVLGSKSLHQLFIKDPLYISGTTFTSIGFYGPQGRNVRSSVKNRNLIDDFSSITWNGKRITNLEMETSGIYTLAANLGHEAISINALLANRQLGTFSKNPAQTVEKMIKSALAIIVKT